MNTEPDFSVFSSYNSSLSDHSRIDRSKDNIILYSSNRAGLHDFSEVLKNHGTKFTATADIDEAHVLINSKAFDAIMVDVTGLDEQGLSMIKWARFNGKHDLKVFGFTRTDFYNIVVNWFYVGAEGTFCYEGSNVLELARVLFMIMINNTNLNWVQTLSESQGSISRKVRSGGNPNAPLLVRGPEGAGKIALAVVAHSLSARKDGPFIVADCNPRHAFNYVGKYQRDTKTNRSMLRKSYKRLFGLAVNGTLFIRSFHLLPRIAQQELAKVVHSGKCLMPGKEEESKFKGRIILSTNMDVDNAMHGKDVEKSLIEEGIKNVMTIPSLYEFRDEIPLLANEIVSQFCERMNAENTPQFTKPAIDKMMNYDWPGNLQELFDVVSTALDNHAGGKIGEAAIIFRDKETYLPKDESDRLLALLIKNRWRKEPTGDAMGYSRMTVGRRIKEYGFPETWEDYLELKKKADAEDISVISLITGRKDKPKTDMDNQTNTKE